MRKVPLTKHDIKILKEAQCSYKRYLFSISLGVIFFVTVLLMMKLDDEIKDWPFWLVYLIPILLIVTFLSKLNKTFDFTSDIKGNEKMVFNGHCTRTCDRGGEGTDTHYLQVEGYDRIELKSYDFNNVQYLFPEKQEVYCEIHIAPKSRTILQVKK